VIQHPTVGGREQEVSAMRCSKCGATNPDRAKFCEECASPLKRRCASCDTENSPTAKFCIECAKPLESGKSQRTTTASSPIPVGAGASDAALEGERKTVTALFADIKGSTELMEDLDPEEARAIVDPALKLMVEAVRRHDGYVVQSTGDGIFALFGAPVACEDHPQRAIHAALSMQRALREYAARLAAQGHSPVEARVGVNTGEVVLREIHTGGHPEYTPIGHTANLAARLQTIAPSGSIAVSDHTRLLVQGYFDLRPLGAFPIKGLTAPAEVYEVTRPGPQQDRFQVAVKRGLGSFIGRGREIEEIGRALALVRIGRGQIVAVTGEPGVGKSRLLHEFKQKRPAECLLLEAAAISHSASAPYHVVIELLRNYFRLLPEDTQQQRWKKVESKIAEYGLQDTLHYICPLLALPLGDAGAPESDLQLRKRRTVDAVKQLLLMESRRQPLLLVIEDVHWLDRESRLFLSVLASSITTAHILGLVSIRPEFRHEFGNRSYYKQINLSPLDADEAHEMLQSHLGHGPVPSELEQFVVEKSEGNPLFIEEILQALFDQGVLVRGDTTTVARPLNAITIPTTIRGILSSRIDRLSATEKELLQVIAVIGRKSPLRLLNRVVSWPENQLEMVLAKLQFLELAYEQPSELGPEYALKHALTQDVAYGSLLREKRALLHENAARAIEAVYGDWLDDHLDELARHYECCGNVSKTVHYLHLGGRQALSRSALADGVSHLTRALTLLENNSASQQRAEQELQIRLLLGPALMASEGYASPKVEEIYSRARELCGMVSDPSQLCAVLYGLFGIHNTRAAYSTAKELANEMIRLAESLEDPVFGALASFSAGQTQFLLGAPSQCRRWFERTAGVYSRDRKRELMLLAGFDCGIATMAWDSVAMWMLGYPDGALSKMEHAAALARESGHPHSLVYALNFRAWLRHFRREWPAALEGARTVCALADEHGLPLWGLWATLLGGAAMVEEGQTQQGREQLNLGLEAMRVAGARITMTQTLGLVARAYERCADAKKALALIEEALTAAETSGERYYLAELNRLRGELLLISDPSNNEQAEQCFRTSIDLAQTQEAKSLELRATVNLTRLLSNKGRCDEARTMLSEIYSWFTEGFDTTDLKEAKTLLDELTR
jgi:class 3 adenylate cyclase/predicted ATPase